jgi:hypothetical protein
MCAEAVWWRCHRRIIADYLLAAGERVIHILAAPHVDEANLTAGAVGRGDRTVVYPPKGRHNPNERTTFPDNLAGLVRVHASVSR